MVKGCVRVCWGIADTNAFSKPFTVAEPFTKPDATTIAESDT
jgi:hypothetical protein